MKILHNLSKATLLAFTIMAFALVSCKSDDPEPAPVDNNPIVGTWLYVSVAPEVPGTLTQLLALIPVVAPCIDKLEITFNSNNTVTAAKCNEAVTAMAAAGLTIGTDTKWQVNGTKLKLTNGSTVKEFPINQQTNQMTITVNTNTDLTIPPVNAIITVKRI